MEIYNRRALEISQEAEYMVGIATSTLNLGDVAFQKGDFDDALDYYNRSYEVAECSGMNDLRNLSQFQIGDAFFMLSKYEEAIHHYETARFYEKQKQYKSAMIYYNDILTNYPDSEWSVKALEREQVLKGKKWGS